MTKKVLNLHGKSNPSFVLEEYKRYEDPHYYELHKRIDNSPPMFKDDLETLNNTNNIHERDRWGKGVEFLFSCISMSVGLGNVWRFPYAAYENGGGAFLIPYLIVLVLIGKPIYFMEMIMGQFSSTGGVKAYNFAPALKGNGVAQAIAVACVMTYYSSIMALIIYYLFASFSSVLPWTVCDSKWTDCFSSSNLNITNSSGLRSSSELYFLRTVTNELNNIENGIGLPNWKLVICLIIAWTSVFLVVFKGVKSSGKASYFLAIFPYVIMSVLLIRAVTLPGADKGIWFFIKPNFAKLLDPKVWYNAVTQCFFSLSACFGAVIMFSSYNDFERNIYKDVLIITTMDTITSLLAGCTIFGILGNLAETTGRDIKNVVRGGGGLAFISYPEAISKFQTYPQIFSVLFFLMLFILGIGSNVGMISSVITVIRDRFPKISHWKVLLFFVIIGFCIGCVYITPGGQFILNLVDHHGGQFIVYFLGILQCISITWIYGLQRFCDDIEFMLKKTPSFYWRICWAIITPISLIVILIYTLIELKEITYNGVAYPVAAIIIGWIITCSGLIQWPLFAGLSFYKRRNLGMAKMFKSAFSPKDSYGPANLHAKQEWIAFKEIKNMERSGRVQNAWKKYYDKIMGY